MRTTEELLKDADIVATLNKKRTQGDWVKLEDGEDSEESHVSDWATVGLNEDKIVCRVGVSYMSYHCEYGDMENFTEEEKEANTKYIAHAPQMAALIAELSAKLREREWQDIETARKEERWIMGWDKNFGGHVKMKWAEDCWCGDYVYEPTKWMPLPTPPKKDKGHG